MMKCESMTINEARKDHKGWIIQEKIDGTRTFYKCGVLDSPERAGLKAERFAHIQNELRKMVGIDVVLDGEIYLPNGCVHQVNASENWKKCRYGVFDVLEVGGRNLREIPFSERRSILNSLLAGCKFSDTVREFDSLEQGWNEVVSKELEGLVIKNPQGKYYDTRNWAWIKIKNYKEAVEEIVGFEEGSVKGAFLLANGGKMSALSADKVREYKELKAKGRVFAELEYLYKTKTGKYFQPILKRLVIK